MRYLAVALPLMATPSVSGFQLPSASASKSTTTSLSNSYLDALDTYSAYQSTHRVDEPFAPPAPPAIVVEEPLPAIVVEEPPAPPPPVIEAPPVPPQAAVATAATTFSPPVQFTPPKTAPKDPPVVASVAPSVFDKAPPVVVEKENLPLNGWIDPDKWFFGWPDRILKALEETPEQENDNALPLNGWIADPDQPLFGLPGIVESVGFFDPLEFSFGAVGDAKRLREAELVHARLAMLAFVGFLVGEMYEGAFQLTGPAINQMDQLPDGVFQNFIFFSAVCEFRRLKRGWVSPNFLDGSTLFTIKEDYYPGDLGFDPFGLKPSNSWEDFAAMEGRELNNGRLAMIGVSLMCLEEHLTHEPIFDQILPPVCNLDTLSF